MDTVFFILTLCLISNSKSLKHKHLYALVNTSNHSKLTDYGLGVYVAWLNGAALYVGYSETVYRRVSRNPRKEKNRHLAFLEADCIEIYPCDSLKQAIHLEAELIGLYNPPYNRIGHLQSSRNLEQLRSAHNKLFGGAS